jgi:hypothetical protein
MDFSLIFKFVLICIETLLFFAILSLLTFFCLLEEKGVKSGGIFPKFMRGLAIICVAVCPIIWPFHLFWCGIWGKPDDSTIKFFRVLSAVVFFVVITIFFYIFQYFRAFYQFILIFPMYLLAIILFFTPFVIGYYFLGLVNQHTFEFPRWKRIGILIISVVFILFGIISWLYLIRRGIELIPPSQMGY